ncbi:MAG TPA: hypothetical protein PLL98_07760, partial [Bacillota bacterium]|nr:hypothetical protein [Bacillota bacterium]
PYPKTSNKNTAISALTNYTSTITLKNPFKMLFFLIIHVTSQINYKTPDFSHQGLELQTTMQV